MQVDINAGNAALNDNNNAFLVYQASFINTLGSYNAFRVIMLAWLT